MNVELLIRPSMIIPNNQITLHITFLDIILGCNIKSHFLINSGNDFILDIRVGERELPVRFYLDVPGKLRFFPALFLVGDPGSVAFLFGDVLLLDQGVPVNLFGKVRPQIEALLKFRGDVLFSDWLGGLVVSPVLHWVWEKLLLWLRSELAVYWRLRLVVIKIGSPLVHLIRLTIGISIGLILRDRIITIRVRSVLNPIDIVD